MVTKSQSLCFALLTNIQIAIATAKMPNTAKIKDAIIFSPF